MGSDILVGDAVPAGGAADSPSPFLGANSPFWSVSGERAVQPPVEEGRSGRVQSYRVGVPCPRPRDFGEPQLGLEKQDKGGPCTGSKVSWSLEEGGGGGCSLHGWVWAGRQNPAAGAFAGPAGVAVTWTPVWPTSRANSSHDGPTVPQPSTQTRAGCFSVPHPTDRGLEDSFPGGPASRCLVGNSHVRRVVPFLQ